MPDGKKNVIKSKFSTFLTILLALLIIIESCIFLVSRKKSGEELFFVQTPELTSEENKDLKTFISINETRNISDSEGKIAKIYDCSFFNYTEHDFYDWTVRLKISNNSDLVGLWNANFELQDGNLTITPESDFTNVIHANSSYSFGFILRSFEYETFPQINYSGKFSYQLKDNRIHGFISILIVVVASILIVVLIQNLFTKNEIHTLKLLKERDNAIIEQTMKTFVNFIDAKDEYTRGHSTRVAEYSRKLAEKMGFDEQFQQDMYYMGLMHDVGKITIPDEILNKTSRLSADEWKIIKLHTTNGAKLLQDFNVIPSIRDAVLYHHERYDGKGYMGEIRGEEIPLVARIICVADSFDAMNTSRCYRLKFSKERIIHEIERCSGRQFDPWVARTMIELLRSGEIECDSETNKDFSKEKEPGENIPIAENNVTIEVLKGVSEKEQNDIPNEKQK